MKSHSSFLKVFGVASLAVGSASTFAHDGHGLLGSHWHATDVLGFVAAGGVVALLVWLAGRGGR